MRAAFVEGFWNELRFPRGSEGIVLFARLRLPPEPTPEREGDIGRQWQTRLREIFPGPELPQVIPFASGIFLISLVGNFPLPRWRLIREQIRLFCQEWGAEVGVNLSDLTEPYHWWDDSLQNRKENGDFLGEELQRVMAEGSLYPVYQPIVSLQDGRVMGWEALIRTVPPSPLAMPEVLFHCATRMGLLVEVDGLCQQKILQQAAPLTRQHRVFINVHPTSLDADEPAPILGLVEKLGIVPGKVVIEITERQAISDFARFRQRLDVYRKAGFKIAVDDAGSGYSSLQSIAEISPDFVKLDRSLVHNVDSTPGKRVLVSVITEFIARIGCHLIAEGIETLSELTTLIELGVEFGQGYYLARPAAEPPLPAPAKIEEIASAVQLRRQTMLGRGHPLAQMKVLRPTLRPHDPVNEILDMFHTLTDNDGLPVLDALGIPVGLLMKRNLMFRLALPFGHELVLRRSVEYVMDSTPLILPETTTVETAAQRVLNRDPGELDDHVIVVRDGKYSGVVPARNILERMTQLQVNQAKHSNPLTGLPGNVLIESTVNSRLSAGERIAILHIDLNNFKPYNDHYGIASGDNVIKQWACLLKNLVEERNDGRDFLGHLGGDDFLWVTAAEGVETLARTIIARFSELAPSFYQEADRRRGAIKVKNREGQITEFPLLAVSVAGLGNVASPLQDWQQATELLVPIKLQAKQMPPPGMVLVGCVVEGNGNEQEQ